MALCGLRDFSLRAARWDEIDYTNALWIHSSAATEGLRCSDYFDLGTAELCACQRLLWEARALLLGQDSSTLGFNVGINSGAVAGQTVMHSHIHLIPRRDGDSANPRGGVRGVIPGK